MAAADMHGRKAAADPDDRVEIERGDEGQPLRQRPRLLADLAGPQRQRPARGEPGEVAEVLPGVTVEMDGYAVELRAEPDSVEGRLFVFEEDEFEERSWELVAE